MLRDCVWWHRPESFGRSVAYLSVASLFVEECYDHLAFYVLVLPFVAIQCATTLSWWAIKRRIGIRFA